MKRVYWDSMLFIYWLEMHPEYGAKVESLYRRSIERGDQFFTGIFTVGEVLVAPKRLGNLGLSAAIEQFFDAGRFTLLGLDRNAMRIFSDLRANVKIAAPKIAPVDAFHLACAGAYGIDAFLTNDKALLRLEVPGIGLIGDLNYVA